MQAEVEATPERVNEARKEITSLCAPYHGFDVLFAVWSTTSITRPGTLKPIDAQGSSAVAEYVAHVLLDRDSAEATRQPTKLQLAQGSPDPMRLGDLVRDVLHRVPAWFQFRQAGGKHEVDPYLEMRVRLRMHRLAVRSLAYEWQERQTLHDLFDPFEERLREDVGFDLDQALKLCESLGALPLERAGEYGSRAREFSDWLKSRVRVHREGGHPDVGPLAHLVNELAKLRPKEANARIERLGLMTMSAGLGQHAAFTADELAEHAGVDTAASMRFLDGFCVHFGHRADAKLWTTDPEKAIGGEIEVMRRRPIVADGQGRFLASSVDSVFFGLRDMFTDALKGEQKHWERFRRQRGEVLERRALEALSRALRADWAHPSVKYELLSDDDETTEQGEADGVLRAGTVLVLLEAKAGALAPSARRAAPERLAKGLTDLVADAHAQLERSRRALVDGFATKVTDSNGKPLTLDLDGITRVLRVSVTLEDLSGIVPAAWQLQDAGLLPPEHRAPWIIGIHELEIICELVERPAQLVHYVARRHRANRQRIWAIDELDFFIKYLHDGLFYDDDELAGAFLQLASYTDPLDAYLYGERGLMPRSRRPRQKLNAATRGLLDAIEATESPGAIEAQMMILDMDRVARERVAGAINRLARKSHRDGKPHDETLVFSDDFAATVMSCPEQLRPQLGKQLERLGAIRTERSGLGRWLGLGVVAGAKGKLIQMGVLVAPERVEAAELPLVGPPK